MANNDWDVVGAAPLNDDETKRVEAGGLSNKDDWSVVGNAPLINKSDWVIPPRNDADLPGNRDTKWAVPPSTGIEPRRHSKLSYYFNEEGGRPTIGDVKNAFAVGSNNILTTSGQAMNMAARGLTDNAQSESTHETGGLTDVLTNIIHGVGEQAHEQGKSGEEYWIDKLTPAGKKSMGGDIEDHPLGSVVMSSAQSAPGMLAMGGLTGPLTETFAATKIGSRIAPYLTRLGVSPDRAARIAEAIPSALGAGASEGIFSGFQNAEQTGDEVRNMDPMLLAKNPYFQRQYSKIDPSLSPQDRFARAREAAAQAAENYVLVSTGVWDTITGAASGGGLLGQIQRAPRGVAHGALSGFGAEGLQEFVQSGGEQLLQNLAARRYYDADRPVMDQVGTQALVGGGSGGLLGLVGGGAHGLAHRNAEDQPERDQTQERPSAGTTAPPGPPQSAAPAAAPPIQEINPEVPLQHVQTNPQTPLQAASQAAHDATIAQHWEPMSAIPLTDEEMGKVNPEPEPDTSSATPPANVPRQTSPSSANPDDILRFIARNGGISRAEAEAEGIDPAYFNDRISRQVFGKPLFPRKGGMSMDGIAELLSQTGYMPDGQYHANDALDLVHRALGGESIYSVHDAHRVYEQQAAQREADHQAQTEQAITAAPSEDEAVSSQIENPTPDELSNIGYHEADEPARDLTAVMARARAVFGDDALDGFNESFALRNSHLSNSAYELAYTRAVDRMLSEHAAQQTKRALNGESDANREIHAVVPEGQRNVEEAAQAGTQPSAERPGEVPPERPALQPEDRRQVASGQTADMFGGKSETAQAVHDAEVDRQRRMAEAPPVESGAGDLFSGKSKQTDIEDFAGGKSRGGDLVASGTYRDGGKWSAVYKPERRTDGTAILTRIFTDDEGTREQYLDINGMWVDGKASTVIVGGRSEKLTGPEEFISIDDAIQNAKEVHGASEQAREPERRTNLEQRKRVQEMSPDEMRAALLTDAKTGLYNERAYHEHDKLPVQIAIDLDSLKWVNDNMGHESGDKMLKAMGEAVLQHTALGYRIGGDEFVVQARNELEARRAMEAIDKTLSAAVITVQKPDGSTVTKKGVGFSYGYGKDLQTADAALVSAKGEREASGQRAGRGATPPGVVERPAERQYHQERQGAEEVAPPETPEKIRTQRAGTETPPQGGVSVSVDDEAEDKSATSDVVGTKDGLRLPVGGPPSLPRYIYVVPSKVIVEGGSGNPKRLGDLFDVQSLRSQGLGALDVPSQRMVMAGMLARAHEPKVLNSVVGPVAVKMVNMLSVEKFTAETLRNNPAVLKHLFSVSPDINVSVLSESSALSRLGKSVRAVADLIAETPVMPNKVDGSENIGTAPSALNGLGSGETTAPVGAEHAPLDEGSEPGKPDSAVFTNNVDKAAHDAATSPTNDLPEPTEGQKEAGNYKKGSIWINGLHIRIENPAGTHRRPHWPELTAHYGYIVETSQGKAPRGKDKDHIDVFLGPHAENPNMPVFVVDQVNPDNRAFDEHKVMLGYEDVKAATVGYHENYKNDWSGMDGITEMSLDQFKDWLNSGKTKEPASQVENGRMSLTRKEAERAGHFNDVQSVSDEERSASPATSEPGDTSAPGSIQDVGEKIGGARKDLAESTGPRTKREKSEVPGWRSRYEISQIAKSAESGQEGRWVISDKRKEDWRGRSDQVGDRNGYATKEDAEAAIPLVAVSRNHSVGLNRDGKYEIWRNVTDRKRVNVVDQQFDNRDDALRYMAKHAEDIINTKTSFGEEILPLPDKVQREGAKRRTGNVTGDDFRNTYGFRGVEFGNWNNQEERQQVMNHAYDALADLAEVLNVPPRAIGLNGDLALAFGARGQGLSGARAHYERNYGVINLTKMQGAGALAHEWLHAFDHYLGRQDTKASSERVQNERGDTVFKSKSVQEDYASHGFKRDGSGVRPEVRDAYKNVIDTMFNKAEKYVEDTQKADKFVGAARDDVAKKLDAIRANLASDLTKDPAYGKYYEGKRNTKAASAEQLAEFDGIAQKILNGELLDTEWRHTSDSKTRRNLMSGRWTNDALEKISAIYKAVRGRSGFDSTNNNGTLDELRTRMKLYSARLRMLADAQAGEEKTKKVPTSYAMEAKSIDQGRASEYWATPHEMAARAFQAYVEDKIAEKGGRSDFLTYGTNKVVPTPWGWKRPFPHGEERQAINTAFDKLVDTLKTKETDKGVALMNRRPRAITGDDTLVSAGLSILGRNDEMFQLPVSNSKTMDGIAKDVYPDLQVVDFGKDHARNFNADAIRAWTLNLPDKDGKIQTASAIELPNREIYLNISDFREGGSGNAIYHIVANYAHNNGLKFIGDPYGLSDAALRRRTENMLSTAFKFGTTEHIGPHERQIEGDKDLGVPPLDWKEGDDAHNINKLAEVSYASIVQKVPELANIKYNFETHRFEDADGNKVGDKRFVELASEDGAREARAGRDTLKRTAVINTLLQTGRGPERGRILGELLRQSREHLDPALRNIFYSQYEGRPQGGLSDSETRMSADGVRTNIAPITEKWKNGPQVQVVQSAHELPDYLAHELRSQQAEHISQGLFDTTTGHVWLIADNLRNADEAQTTLLHEAFVHYGLRQLLGDKIVPVLRDVSVMYGKKGLADVAAEYGFDLNDPRDRLMAAEEQLAKIAQTGEKPALLKRAYGLIRDWLRQMGFTLKMNDSDIAHLIAGARRSVEQGISARELGGDEGVRLSRATPSLIHGVRDDKVEAAASLRPNGQYEIYWGNGPSLTESQKFRRQTVASAAQVAREFEKAGLETNAPSKPATAGPERPEMFQGFDVPSESTKDLILRHLQDKFRRLKIIEGAITDQGGAIDEGQDAYLWEELMHGKAEERIREFEDQHVKPLVDAMHKAGVSLAEVDQYLYAKHAPERNAKIAEINPHFRDNDIAGSGMTDDEARRILADFDSRGLTDKLQSIADRVYAINEERLRLLEDDGLEDQRTVDTWRNAYENYVPLRGSDEEEDKNRPRVGRGFDIRGKESRRALGRSKKAASPLTYAVQQMEESIIRSEKNDVGKALLRLVQAHPNPELWEINKVEYAPRFDQTTGEVVYGPKPGYQHADNVLSVKVDGKPVLITLHDDGLARAMKNLGPQTSNMVVRGMATVNRYLAALSTSFNPEFVLTNFARDLQTALINLYGEQGARGHLQQPKGIVRRVLKDIPKSLAGIYAAQRGVDKALFGALGKSDAVKEWAKHFDEYRLAGGKVGFYAMRDIETKRKQILHELKVAKGGTAASAHKIMNLTGELISDVNGAVENAIRLAAYKNARDLGLSEMHAASLAKNLTVNFNRKGELGTIANAMYMFYNAGVQGSMRFLYALKSPKVQKIAAGMVAATFLLALMNRWLAGEDKDGRNYWDKIPNWIKDRNLIVMRGDGKGGYYMLPMPYGYNILGVLGNVFDGVMNGHDPMKEAAHLAGATVDAFNPVGNGDGGILQMISPTITDPLVQLSMNQNWHGVKIVPDQNQYGVPKPNSQRYWSSVSPIFKEITDKLNEWTGGNTVRPGKIDISPEVLRFMVQQFTGGAGAFLDRSASYVTSLLKGEDVEANQIPFVRRFVGQQSEFRSSSDFYKNRDDIFMAREEVKALRKQGKHDEAQKAAQDNAPQLGMYGRANALNQRMQEDNKRIRDIRANRNLSEDDKATRIKNIQQRMHDEMDRFNRAYYQRTGKTPD